MQKGFEDNKIVYMFASAIARIAQLVEHDLAKVGVAGSSPVSRSFFMRRRKTKAARMAELVDARDLKSRIQCGCAGSRPAPGTKKLSDFLRAFFVSTH